MAQSNGGFTLALAFGPDGLLYYIDIARVPCCASTRPAGSPRRSSRVDRRTRSAGAERARLRRRRQPLPHRELVGDRAGPGVYRIEPGGRGELWSSGPFLFANGIAVAPDDSAVYVAETWSRQVARVPVLPTARQAVPRALLRAPGHPSRRARLRPGRAPLRRLLPAEPGDADRRRGEPAVLVRDDDAMVLAHPAIHRVPRADGVRGEPRALAHRESTSPVDFPPPRPLGSPQRKGIPSARWDNAEPLRF